jgi:hypothetical protein
MVFGPGLIVMEADNDAHKVMADCDVHIHLRTLPLDRARLWVAASFPCAVKQQSGNPTLIDSPEVSMSSRKAERPTFLIFHC